MLFSFLLELTAFGWVYSILFLILFLFIIVPLTLAGLFVFFPSCFFKCLNSLFFLMNFIFNILNLFAYPFHVYYCGKYIENLDKTILKPLDKLLAADQVYDYRQCMEWAESNGYRFLGFFLDDVTKSESAVWYLPELSTLFEFHLRSDKLYYLILYTTFDNNRVLCSETQSDDSFIPYPPNIYRQIFMKYTLWNIHSKNNDMMTKELEDSEHQKIFEEEYTGEDSYYDEYDDFDDDYEDDYEDDGYYNAEDYKKEEMSEKKSDVDNYSLIAHLYQCHKEAVDYLIKENKVQSVDSRILELEWGNDNETNSKRRHKQVEEAIKKGDKEKLSRWYIRGYGRRCQKRVAFVRSIPFWRLTAGLWPIFLPSKFDRSIMVQFASQSKKQSK